MRKLLVCLFVFGFYCFAEKPETTVTGRIGMRNAATFHFAEMWQTHRGKYIYPDIGYFDGGRYGYWETFFGGGVVSHNSKHFTLVNIGYLDRAHGSKSDHALCFLPWTLVGYRITKRVSGETVYFPYLPLNKSARLQHVLDYSKVEYDFGKIKLGGGYAAYQYGEKPWEHKPFLITTFKTNFAGNIQLWVQRIAGNRIQAQVRVVKTLKNN